MYSVSVMLIGSAVVIDVDRQLQTQWAVIAQRPHLRIVKNDTIENLATFGGCLVCKEVITLVGFTRLVAPEALDLSAVLRPMAVVKTAIGKNLEELGVRPTAVNRIPMSRRVQVAANYEPSARSDFDQLFRQHLAILSVIAWTDMNTGQEEQPTWTLNRGTGHVRSG
jgi:hypothetical protein